MKHLILFLLLALPGTIRAAEVPMSLAGITLGSDISSIGDFCDSSTDIPLADERHLSEMLLRPGFVPGVKNGSVAYANCSQKGRIVRIKLKFDDSSRVFYNDLRRRYEEVFGKPSEWRGDPLQTVISWKWSFSGDDGQRVSLELTHSNDDDYKLGNFVKMTLRSLWEEEAACRSAKYPQNAGDNPATPAGQLDYRLLVPR
jgi:hypothetical protein